jgi:hypothetical protein
MKKIIIIAIIILGALAVGVLGLRLLSGEDDWICANGEWIKHGAPDAPKPTEPCPGSEAVKNENIRVTKPVAGDIITSPLQIEGEARLWYFEASFPVKLVDDNGTVLAQGPAQAQSDWMTENFVAFKAELKFNLPATEKGKLILSKDNPSGLPQYDEQIEIPVIFGKFETTKLKVFFNNNKLDPEVSCNKVFAAERNVPKTTTVARAALEELLRGPTDAEKADGFFTSINPGVKIQKLTIENGVAKVDFDETLERQVGGSCRVFAIRAEITETLKQFPTVKSVIISIDGRTEDILQP